MIHLIFRKLSNRSKRDIAAAIRKAEAETSGEIQVHLSYAKDEDDILGAAKARFAVVHLHETKYRNCVLLYVNLRMKKFALYGDEGIHQKVGQNFWNDLSLSVSQSMKEKNVHHGMVHAVEKIGKALKDFFPSESGGKSALSDEVSESD